ncbi:homocysteine S-methyltransferase family protein [Nocardioides sp.]|uniref:homocysteine S-methyltransferase family protein n=1 Tax=Nocardioides sp. TaxID=35761 RepID=UPI002722064C|nr:homocysteine S-methyltransferase family protein [Nocardioides sp.]MDO9456831.1 homocysteine S-methyltransferase family protein [Nocardioides sp.]
MATDPRRITDGGLETDLIFHRGRDLPEFAAFPLLDDEPGRGLLRDYYTDYVALAARAQVPLLLETPTWRANPDWGVRVGYDDVALGRVNRDAVDFLRGLDTSGVPHVEVGGVVGPRGDGYVPGAAVDPDEAAAYHRPQLQAFRDAGATRATALTLTDVGEAIGVARAGADLGIPVGIGFTVETDGRLPGGTTLAEAVERVDADTPPDYFLVNCAHPEHVERGLDDGLWRLRVGGLRVNASTLSHAELDESTELDDGDPLQLATDHARLVDLLPAVRVVGGCCGTDVRHVAALWGQDVNR